ncbi:MAG TPA: di-heme oxidoredictase family protein [Chitinophagaceae bacterium]|nr:di-heme oxidoredictase family protein [Chitinophagaceae bacterium]
MKKYIITGSLFTVIFSFTMCHKAGVFDSDDYDNRLSGGAATVFDATSKAFTHEVSGLSERDQHVHELGDGAFEQTFVAPGAARFGGLGPVFNNVSCISCHHNDGKGTPTAGFATSSLLFRLSLPGSDEHGGPVAVPGYGLQLQDQALFGVACEAKINISYTDVPVTYPDGSSVMLRKPVYTLTDQYIPMPANYLLSPRLAPPVFGAGLLENIPEDEILSFVDSKDENADGITGKANYVYNPYTQKTELGRFGLKANTPTLLLQVATAYQQDMGVTSYMQPKESVYGQLQDDKKTDDPELPDSILNAVAFYVKTLGVPARRSTTDPEVKRGEVLFNQVNCSGCHKPSLQTGVNVTLPQISNQLIHAYTDLLVHNMGEGLADNRPDYLAGGSDWRTMPLWGIGLFDKTNGIPYYLHDGRARTLEEAILWHDGEAKNAKQGFMALSKTDRDMLIKFLQSL